VVKGVTDRSGEKINRMSLPCSPSAGYSCCIEENETALFELIIRRIFRKGEKRCERDHRNHSSNPI
jgi:hypothetical protein